MHGMNQKYELKEGEKSVYISPFAGNKTFLDLSLEMRVDVVRSVCHYYLDSNAEASFKVRDHGQRELRNKPVGIDWKSKLQSCFNCFLLPFRIHICSPFY